MLDHPLQEFLATSQKPSDGASKKNLHVFGTCFAVLSAVNCNALQNHNLRQSLAQIGIFKKTELHFHREGLNFTGGWTHCESERRKGHEQLPNADIFRAVEWLAMSWDCVRAIHYRFFSGRKMMNSQCPADRW